jgi:mannose-6-phosphate isomerase-like protein (cupin superfamily)
MCEARPYFFLEDCVMRRIVPLLIVSAALVGFLAGYALRPVVPSSALSVVPSALAQEKKSEVMPFNYNSPREPALAPDAPPTTYWSVDDLRKAHTDLAAVASKALKEAGTGSSQSFGGGPVHLSTRNFSIFQLYRVRREQPVPSLTKVSSIWDDAEMHAGAYDFYVITGGTGEMIVGGKIANRQNLMDKDGPVPGEYRGQPIIGGQTFKVKEGDCLLIPPDTPHQPKPDAGGFSYVIMKINVGVYPWSLIR